MVKKPGSPSRAKATAAKNAAPVGFVAQLQERAEILGVPWVEAVRRAEISRQTAWRLAKGGTSLATARRIEAVLDNVEKARGGLSSEDRELRLTAWLDAGRGLLLADRDRFDDLLEQVRLLAEHIRLERQADAKLHEILTPQPK
jgi:hypothetical protein